MPHWIWANEPTADDEAMIYGRPSIIEKLGIEFDSGALVTKPVPLVEIERDEDSQGVLPDNVNASGTTGLLFSSRLRHLIASLGIDNIQYFPTVIRNPEDKSETADYQIANILGRVSCLDKEKSVLHYSRRNPDEIEFFDSLVIDETRAGAFDFFRLHEFDQIVVVSDRVKAACENARVSGIQFYKPEDFTL